MPKRAFYILYSFSLFLSTSCFGQITDSVFTYTDIMPEPKEGYVPFYTYIHSQVLYPQAAIDRNITGSVFLQFIVDQQGQIGNLKVLKGLGFGCEEELIRVFSNLPAWKPGSHQGKPVQVKMTFRFIFELPSK